MQIREIMTSGVECIAPNATLQEAAQEMKRLDVGALPICGEDDRLAGMITDRDIVVRAVAEGSESRTAGVEDFMTPEAIYCFDQDSVEQAAGIMKEKQVRRILVLNQDKQLVGVVSLGDLATRCENDQMSGDALESVSEPAR